MEDKLVMTIFGCVLGIIVVVPIGITFGGIATGILGVLVAGAGTYFSEYLIIWIKERFVK